jgi:hypothetical protein
MGYGLLELRTTCKKTSRKVCTLQNSTCILHFDISWQFPTISKLSADDNEHYNENVQISIYSQA